MIELYELYGDTMLLSGGMKDRFHRQGMITSFFFPTHFLVQQTQTTENVRMSLDLHNWRIWVAVTFWAHVWRAVSAPEWSERGRNVTNRVERALIYSSIIKWKLVKGQYVTCILTTTGVLVNDSYSVWLHTDFLRIKVLIMALARFSYIYIYSHIPNTEIDHCTNAISGQTCWRD